MIDLSLVPLGLVLPVSFAGGLGLGVVFFHSLRAAADILVKAERPLLGMALMMARILGLGAGLYLAVLAGGPALLAALAGVLCGKALVMRRMREAEA